MVKKSKDPEPDPKPEIRAEEIHQIGPEPQVPQQTINDPKRIAEISELPPLVQRRAKSGTEINVHYPNGQVTAALMYVWDDGMNGPVPFNPNQSSGGTSQGATILLNADTGIQNAWNPGVSVGETFLQWQGSADLILNGLAGGVKGAKLTIQNVASSNIYIVNNSASSTADKFYNSVSSAPTPISLSGYATYIHNGNGWIMITHEQGDAISIPFDASNYDSYNPSGAWTQPSATDYAYAIKGSLVFVTVQLSSGALSQNVSALILKFPFQFAGPVTGVKNADPISVFAGPLVGSTPTTSVVEGISWAGDPRYIFLRDPNGAQFKATPTDVNVQFSGTFRIV